MEGHPEENHDGEDEEEGHETVLGLLRGEFLYRSGSRLGLLCSHIGVLEPAAAGEVDGHGEYEGHAGDAEAEAVGAGKGIQIGRILAGSVIYETLPSEHGFGDFPGHCRCEHRTYVDCHIEETEGRVALCAVTRVVVEIADEHLEVTLEETRAHGHEGQSGEHNELGGGAVARRKGQGQIAQEHHGNAYDHAFAVAYLVSDYASDQRHEINSGEENGIDLAGCCFAPAETRLHQQGENGEHGVVAEALAGVGEGQGIQSFRLTFEHRILLF